MNTDYTLGLVLLISGSRRSILYVRVHFKFLFIEFKKKIILKRTMKQQQLVHNTDRIGTRYDLIETKRDGTNFRDVTRKII